MVIVYSVDECPWCYKLSGDTLVPVTTIDGEEYVVGFDKKKLDELLCL